jgi:hypothetical protein
MNFDLPEMKIFCHGPIAQHNHPCCICRKKHSILDLSIDIMMPCHDCQSKWELKKIKLSWLQHIKKLYKKFSNLNFE